MKKKELVFEIWSGLRWVCPQLRCMDRNTSITVEGAKRSARSFASKLGRKAVFK